MNCSHFGFWLSFWCVMAEYYLMIILYLHRSAVVIPERYSKEQCELVGKEVVSTDRDKNFKCVLAPDRKVPHN